MKMYIPEISDHILLTEDWSFTLHAEYRNETLAKYFGYDFRLNKWIDESKTPIEPERNYTLDYPDRDKAKNFWGKFDYDLYQQMRKDYEASNVEYQKYLVDYNAYLDEVKKHYQEEITITLPKGSILSVDRIYIRKGSSDYSSVTFYAKNLGEIVLKPRFSTKTKKVKSPRFWVKLSDCNNIQFEPTDKIK